MVGLNPLGVFDTGLINELFADDAFQDNYVMPHKSAVTVPEHIDYWIKNSIIGRVSTYIVSYSDIKGGFVEWFYIDPTDQSAVGLSFALLPQFREKHIMAVALTLVFGMLTQQGVEHVFCEVTNSDRKGIRLLNTMGFEFHDMSGNPGPKSVRGIEGASVAFLRKDLK